MKDRKELFRVTSLADGHEFVVYTNGEISGFPEDSYIMNSYPILRAKEKALLRIEMEARYEHR